MFTSTLKKRTRCPRRAMTLLESAIVLGIVGLVLGAVWTAGIAVHNNMRISQSFQDLSILTQNIRDLYRGQSQFDRVDGTDITPILIKADVFPISMMNMEKKKPFSPWQSDVTVTIALSKKAFKITYEAGNGQHASRETFCRNLVGRVAGRGRGDGLMEVSAGGSSYTTNSALNNLTALDLSGSCTSASFTFSLKGASNKDLP